VKCSNSSNHRQLMSVLVPRIKDVSLLCYRFQSERITETAKRSNVVNYLDSILSRPGLLKPNQDILASRRQRLGFRDRVSQAGTVPEKNRDSWSALENGKNSFIVFSHAIISRHHYTMSEDDDIVIMMTWNYCMQKYNKRIFVVFYV